MTSLTYFTALVVLALPASVLYVVIYGTRTSWWRTSIGRALFFKALGLSIMLAFTALVLLLGPEYPGRGWVRGIGMTLICVGVWAALLAMLREFRHR